MNKQLEEYMLDLIEIEAYRELEGKSFDFGTGMIENELSYGTEEAIWEMEQQELEEIIEHWEVNKADKNVKIRPNRYKMKRIDREKLKVLSNYGIYTIYYSETRQRYVRFYLTGCRKLAKTLTNSMIRQNSKK